MKNETNDIIDIDGKETETIDLSTNGVENGCANCYGHSDLELESRNQIESLTRSKKNYTEANSEYIEIEFFSHRKGLYCNTVRAKLSIGEMVVVETDSGEDIGTVYTVGKLAKNKACRCDVDCMPELSVLRKATKMDLARYEEILAEQKTLDSAIQRTADYHNLDLKVISAEWQFDKQRLTICFSAPQRIDFRELVKELAREYRTRIELRQISTREEAKRLGKNIGPCGRPICCSTFLQDFNQVTLDHAKIQHLSNNISKLSGNCIRLKCCLRYEYEMYSASFDKFPPVYSVIDTDNGPAKIIKINIFKNLTTIFYPNDRKYEYLEYDELEAFIKAGKIYVPNDIEICADSHYLPMSEFPEKEKEETVKPSYKPRNDRPRRNNNHGSRNDQTHHQDKKQSNGHGDGHGNGHSKTNANTNRNSKAKNHNHSDKNHKPNNKENNNN